MDSSNTSLHKMFDVIIVGGSYAGLAAAMALGRSLRKVLVIDSGHPCNRQTPRSHNFLTHDGKPPHEIAMLGRQQVEQYESVKFVKGLATKGKKTETGFEITTDAGKTFYSKKIIFATGITDILPDIKGIHDCWGITVLHCPYCHGYEVRNEKTAVIANGDIGYEYTSLISNWTKDLVLITNGKSTLTKELTDKLKHHDINVIEKEITAIEHDNGHVRKLIFKDNTEYDVKVVYARSTFSQHCDIPASLGCELTEDGYIKVDATQKTSVPGVFACGDNTSRMRTVANAVAMGTTSGMIANRELVLEEFQ